MPVSWMLWGNTRISIFYVGDPYKLINLHLPLLLCVGDRSKKHLNGVAFTYENLFCFLHMQKIP